MARSHDDFVDIVKVKNPSVEIVGMYTKAQDRIAVRCKECGYYRLEEGEDHAEQVYPEKTNAKLNICTVALTKK